MLKCKDCKYYMGGDNIQLCKRNSSWEITKPDNDCWFLPKQKELTCGDCWRLHNDMGCAGCYPEESAYKEYNGGRLCDGFVDLKEDEFFEILTFWKSCGIYSREKINSLVDDFEQNYEDLLGEKP